MATLSREQCEFIVKLFCKDGYKQSAIADLVGTTQGNVSKILKKARLKDPAVLRRRPRPIATAPRPPRRLVFTASQLGSAREPLNLDYL